MNGIAGFICNCDEKVYMAKPEPLTVAYIPTCPVCGRECFLPSIQTTDNSTTPRQIWWCRDMGHWVGYSEAVVWKMIQFPEATK